MSDVRGAMGVAVIGAGNISDTYLANMTSYPDLDVRFVADVVTERARQQADKYRVVGSGSVDEALARDDVELVINLTIPTAHAEVAQRALAAGKHVWIEKPLAMNRVDAQSLIDTAAERGLLLGSAPDTVLGPGLQTALRLIGQGDIGRPLTASVVMQNSGPHRWHPNPAFLYQVGAGPLLDMGPYYLTALTYVFGAIRRVVALGSASASTRVIGSGPHAGEPFDVTAPTYVGALYEFASGAVAQATFSFDAPLERTGIVEISGDEATLIAPDPNMFGGSIEVVRPVENRATVSTTFLAPAGAYGRGVGPLDLARAARAGQSPRASGALALHVLDALLATEESILRGGFVDVATELPTVTPLPVDWDPLATTLA